MAKKTAKQVFLIARVTPEKRTEFARLAKRERTTVGAIIRRLVDAYIRVVAP